MRSALLLVAPLILTALAGCATGPSGPQNLPTPSHAFAAPATFTETTGAIEGLVTDDQLVPIQGAEVALSVMGLMTVSDEAGRFIFSKVEPGELTVMAARTGYESASLAVMIFAAEITAVRVVLGAMGAAHPYHETTSVTGEITCEFHLNGTIGFAGEICAIVGALTNANPQPIVRFPFQNGTGYVESVAEMTWRASQSFGDRMKVFASFGATHPTDRYATGAPREHGDSNRSTPSPAGKSPLRIVLNGSLAQEIFKKIQDRAPRPYPECHEPEARCYWQIIHKAHSEGPGFVLFTFQRFDDYMTDFYYAPSPAEFSALADR